MALFSCLDGERSIGQGRGANRTLSGKEMESGLRGMGGPWFGSIRVCFVFMFCFVLFFKQGLCLSTQPRLALNSSFSVACQEVGL